MGSSPTFDPTIFAQPVITQSQYQKLISPSSNCQFVNRATAGQYSTGSVFKPIASIAALQSGAWSLSDTFDDTGSFHIGAETLHNAGNATYGHLDLVDAIRVSSGIFFYNLGALMNVDATAHPSGGALQQWARAFGTGQPTGIDVVGEAAGILPSPSWRSQRNQLELSYEREHHVPCCTLSDLRPWSIGDNINLAVGQADLGATPLQIAVAYAAIENGGTIVRPHVGLDIESPTGTVLQRIDPPPVRHLNINQTYLHAIRTGLRYASSQRGGTSADVFSNLPQPVYGETGTGQLPSSASDSWYAGFSPAFHGKPPIVVVVTVEHGGYGAHTAAPAARQILSQWFLGKIGPWQPGSSRAL
jgi:penicillin-binding protein 2